jgi:hypothetical protein
MVAYAVTLRCRVAHQLLDISRDAVEQMHLQVHCKAWITPAIGYKTPTLIK